jgi:RHH-type transcriptional regulator, rel operon repressor / antitoxin RelB
MPISLRLPADVEARLKNLARLTGRSMTFYATEAICEHIDDLEDLYLAERELEAIRAGKSETVPLEEVGKRSKAHGLANYGNTVLGITA